MSLSRNHSFAIAAALALLLGGLVPAASGDAHVISAQRALELVRAGEIVLIDVRSPDEWRETGVPEGAEPVTLHQSTSGFDAGVEAAAEGDRTRAIALICARGGRSDRARRFLLSAGFTHVLDVSEGMLGSSAGAGWLRAGLPVTRWPAAE